MENVKQGFRHWRERTSTSPSGRKLPPYKIWLQSYDDKNVLQGNEFFHIITDVINISQRLQYPLKRWLQVHNFFIPKDKGVFKPARLRTLHNIEAELNLIRRELIARRLVTNAEYHTMVPMNNSGGRKGRSAIDVVMLKYFTVATMHMQRRNCAITDCDARACYDRILPIILYFTYHKMGLPLNECIWLARALVNMKYQMITTYGPSENVSETTLNNPILGVGQGSTDSCAGWLLVSTRLSHMYNKSANGCTLSSPNAKTTFSLTHAMFVDDAYLFHATQNYAETPHKLQTIVQHDLLHWD